MKTDDITFWVSTPDEIIEKCRHAKRKGQRKILHSTGFGVFNGDVPISRINPLTKALEVVVNNRGRAYGLRNALRYRKSKRFVRDDSNDNN